MGILKDNYRERRAKVKKILETHGRTNINLSALGREFNTSAVTIYNDIKKLAKQGMNVSPEQLKYNCDLTLEKIRKECDKILNDPKSKRPTKLRAADLLLKATDKETEWAEKYGIKPKIAEKIEMTQINARDFYDIWKEVKKEREKEPIVIEVDDEYSE